MDVCKKQDNSMYAVLSNSMQAWIDAGRPLEGTKENDRICPDCHTIDCKRVELRSGVRVWQCEYR